VRDLEPTVPSSLEALVMRCLARDPRFRPQSAGEVAAALTTEEDDHAVTAPTVSSSRRLSRRTPRRQTWKWIALAATFAAVVLVLGLIGIGGNDGGSSRRPTTVARVQTIPPGAKAADEARNLSRWLRANARR
jgi:hypothetical protein